MPARRSARRPARPASAEERVRLTEERRHRAQEELFDIAVRRDRPPSVVEVRNPLRETRYRVYLPAGSGDGPIACECTDFAQRGLGTCKHVEAVRLWLSDHPGALAERPEAGSRLAPLWKEIDRRITQAARDRGPEALRMRRAGALLYETGARNTPVG